MLCRLRDKSLLVVVLRITLLVNIGLFIIGVLRGAIIQLAGSTYQVDIARVRMPIGCNSAVNRSTSHDGNSSALVPNIVHYIWYATEPLPIRWHQMLCVYSAYKILRPDVIYFHTNMEPTGPYWDRILQIPAVRVNKREPPTTLFGEQVKEPIYYTSHSNVDRVKILMEYGGIYLDLDLLVLNPFDDLRRQYECTIGRELDDKVCGSVIICSQHSLFLILWINSYLDDYRVDEWAYNTGKVPFNLARRYPHLVHVDEDRFNRPNFDELELIWSETARFNWRRNYAIHLYYRLWKEQSPFYRGIEPDDDNIKTWNASFGEMARMVLYGSPQTLHTDPL